MYALLERRTSALSGSFIVIGIILEKRTNPIHLRTLGINNNYSNILRVIYFLYRRSYPTGARRAVHFRKQFADMYLIGTSADVWQTSHYNKFIRP